MGRHSIPRHSAQWSPISNTIIRPSEMSSFKMSSLKNLDSTGSLLGGISESDLATAALPMGNFLPIGAMNFGNDAGNGQGRMVRRGGLVNCAANARLGAPTADSAA